MRSFLFLFFAAGLAFSQVSNDPEAVFKKVDPKLVKTTTEYYQDMTGTNGVLVMTRTETYKDGDKVSVVTDNDASYYEHDYDDKGRPKERREMGKDHKLHGKYVYTYADDGSLKVKVTEYDSDGKEVPGTAIEYAYDAKSRFMSAENKSPAGMLRRIDNDYDVADKLTKTTLSSTMNGTKEVDEVTTYTYDPKGWMNGLSLVSGENVLILKATLTAKGDPAEVSWYDELGNLAQRVEIGTTYKESGNESRKASQTWKRYKGEEKTPFATGRNDFKYEYAK